MNTGEEEQPIPLTTRELIAAILLYSGKTIFHEAELVDRVEMLRVLYPVNREFSETSVLEHLRPFVTEQVLRYAGVSNVFVYDRRNDSYLRHILAASHAFPDLESWLYELVSLTAPRATIIEPQPMEART
jgi:hypothetical protein